MNHEPGDLFLSVIDFFGILIPASVLVFLHGNILLGPLGSSMRELQGLEDWIPAFLVAYALGHFLLGSSGRNHRGHVVLLRSSAHS